MTTDGPAELRRLAGDFELTKSECWNESDTTSMWALSVAWGVERAQAAADREDCATFAGQNELLIKATGTETFSAALQRISVCAADRAALAQARSALAEIEREARNQITAPDTNAAQMVVSEAVADTCRRIADVLGGAR